MITTKCEPLEKKKNSCYLWNEEESGGERWREKNREDGIVGISWRQFELPVKQLNAELCGWQLHFADRPWSSPSLSFTLSLCSRWVYYRETVYKVEEKHAGYLWLCDEGAGSQTMDVSKKWLGLMFSIVMIICCYVFYINVNWISLSVWNFAQTKQAILRHHLRLCDGHFPYLHMPIILIFISCSYLHILLVMPELFSSVWYMNNVM